MSELFISSVAFQLSKLHQEDFCNLTLTSVFFLNNTNNQESLSCTGALFLFIYLFFNQK